jgi:aldehyde dehydrogenase (NAD+)
MMKANDDIQSNKKSVSEVFNTQKANRYNVSMSSCEERKLKLKKLHDAILAHGQDIRDALYADFRKPAVEVNLTEILTVISEINNNMRKLKKWMQPHKVSATKLTPGTKSFIFYEAKGMCLILSPWNYPFEITMMPLVAAVSAGNCAIIRPSENTPHIAGVMEEIIKEVFPPNEVYIFRGGREIGKVLMAQPFDHIYFTGSTNVGKEVMHAAADNLASVTLELGGENPLIIDETADIKMAARRIAWGKFLNGGQTCISANYACVHVSKKEEFIAEIKKCIEKYYGKTEEERAQSKSLARVIHTKGFNNIRSLYEDSIQRGAKTEIGGVFDETNLYVSPTIISNVKFDFPVLHTEIFGPMLPVITYSDIDEVLAYVRSQFKPLSLYIFTRSKDNMMKVLRSTTSGQMGVNDLVVQSSHKNLPFGGVNHSGMGSAHGFFGFKAFSHERAVIRQTMKMSATEIFFPPYTGFKEKLSALFPRIQ